MLIPKSTARVSFLVSPGATRNKVLGFTEGQLRIKVAAPPVKGKANRELIAFLSQVLDIGKSDINIIKGHTSRNKLIAIDGLSQEEAMKRLSSSSDDARG